MFVMLDKSGNKEEHVFEDWCIFQFLYLITFSHFQIKLFIAEDFFGLYVFMTPTNDIRVFPMPFSLPVQ